MACHRTDDFAPPDVPVVLLAGPPNVGKSVIFGHLTGVHTGVANYPGTTVELSRGTGTFSSITAVVVDIPGTYTLTASNQAEEVATRILSEPAAVVVVVLDAVFLESSLYLLHQVINLSQPVIAVLNRVDVARERGVTIDHQRLSRELEIPVIPTVAVRKEGVAEVIEAIESQLYEPRHFPLSREIAPDKLWEHAEAMAHRVTQTVAPSNSGWSRVADALIQPWPGLPIAMVVLSSALAVIIGLGMGARQLVLLPLTRGYLFPHLRDVVTALIPEGFLYNVLIGEYGFLIKGIEWPFTLVLPYVVSFYLVVSLLEDSGYLPRLAMLLDGLIAPLGLRGGHTISLLLGYGCAIPGILSARAMGSHKERIILATLISLAVPCISQTGAIFALLAEASILLVPALFLLSWAVMIVTGLILDRLLPGERSHVIFEMPVLLRPQVSVLARKLRGQVVHYLYDGALPMVVAVAVAAVLYESGALVVLGRALAPVVTTWLRLPEGAAVPLLLGVVRRELTVLPLLDMGLTGVQLFTGATVGLFYLPCIAVMATLHREFGAVIAGGMLLLTTGIAFLLGGTIAQAARLLGA